MGQHRTRERRYIRDRAPGGIGFIFTNNLDRLVAGILSSQGDRHSKGRRASVMWRFDQLGARAPRLPIPDFPQSRGGALAVAPFHRSPMLRFETGESSLDVGKSSFG